MVFPEQSPKQLGANPVLTVLARGQIEITIAGGDHCKKADVDRSVSILLHCNMAAGLGSPKFIEEDAGVRSPHPSLFSRLCLTFPGTRI